MMGCFSRTSARPGCSEQPADDRGSAPIAVSYTHLRAHETEAVIVCRLLLEKKKNKIHNIRNNRRTIAQIKPLLTEKQAANQSANDTAQGV